MASLARRVGRIAPDNTVLLLCDLQERFASIIHQFPSCVASAKMLFQATQSLGMPTVVTEQYPKAFKRTVPELLTLVEGADKGAPVAVVEKTRFSMCVPEVDAFLAEHGAKAAILVGIETHVCVLQTSMDLIERGYDVHVVADGVSSQRESDRAVALTRLRDMGAHLTTTESVLLQLLGDSKHPKFKETSKFLKEFNADPARSKLSYL